MKLGVVSDTHGTFHPELHRYLDGTDMVLHAGDIGSEHVVKRLETYAPVVAVYGNTDTFPIVNEYKERELIEVLNKKIYLTHRFIEGRVKVSHIVNDIDDVKPAIVVFGHTHKQYAEFEDGIFYFNPGSCGLRRPGTRTGLGIITITGELINHEFIYLNPHPEYI